MTLQYIKHTVENMQAIAILTQRVPLDVHAAHVLRQFKPKLPDYNSIMSKEAQISWCMSTLIRGLLSTVVESLSQAFQF